MKPLLTLLLTILLVNCSAIRLLPNAGLVEILKDKPEGCQYKGDVTGSQGNFFTGGFTSNAILETGARNNLKNKAYKLGGNTIVLLTDRAGITGSVSSTGRGYYSGSQQQTNVTLSGSVYYCTANR